MDILVHRGCVRADAQAVPLGSKVSLSGLVWKRIESPSGVTIRLGRSTLLAGRVSSESTTQTSCRRAPHQSPCKREQSQREISVGSI